MSNPIPEPFNLQPPTKKLNTAGDIMVPFILADWPRIFLNFLALHSNIPERTKEIIATWLLEHNVELVKYLLENYGYEGAEAAHYLAQAMSQQLLVAVQESYAEEEQELFRNLEEQFDAPDPDADR